MIVGIDTDPDKCFGKGDPQMKDGAEVNCGRLGTQGVCDDGYTCHIHPADQFAVCCNNGNKHIYNFIIYIIRYLKCTKNPYTFLWLYSNI